MMTASDFCTSCAAMIGPQHPVLPPELVLGTLHARRRVEAEGHS